MPGEDLQIGDPNIRYYDHEIWGPEGLVCWQDATYDRNVIWIAQFDPQTGLMIPRDGRGRFVGRAAKFWPDITLRSLLNGEGRSSVQGPEWGRSQAGLGLYYTTLDDAGFMQLARYRLDSSRPEQLTFGGTQDRRMVNPTKDATDPECRIVYGEGTFTPLPTLYVRRENHAEDLVEVPITASGSSGVRWIPGEPSLITNLDPGDGTLQVAKFNAVTQVTTFLTTGPENHSDPDAILAPDRNGHQVVASVEQSDRLAIHENLDGVWTKVAQISPAIELQPADQVKVFSTELFVHQGKTYLFYVVTTKLEFYFPSYVCVASIDGSFNALISDRTPIVRMDPEAYSTEHGLFIYYFTREDMYRANHMRVCRVKLPEGQ